MLEAVLRFHHWQITTPHQPAPPALETKTLPVEEKPVEEKEEPLPFDPTEPEEEEQADENENEKEEKPR